ncbi:hypothetical protein K1719_022911 [Acacia pycnantha]|nr:hypothetical protein K1719_022911 [Acacia pycnantha]
MASAVVEFRGNDSFQGAQTNGKGEGPSSGVLQPASFSLNVRKKTETIVALLSNREKIQEVRNKAAANRDKYFGLSSTRIAYKSGSASYSSGSYQSHGSNKNGEILLCKMKPWVLKFNKGTLSVSQNKDSVSSRVSKSSTKVTKNDKYSSSHSQSSSVAVNDDDDFDPRGTSTAKASTGSSKQVDLFGQDLIGDLMDAPTSVPTEKPPTRSMSEVDLFADASLMRTKELALNPSTMNQPMKTTMIQCSICQTS